MRLQGGFSATDEEINHAWSAMLGHFPKERIQWLKEICNKYRVFLFSNTNAIHYDFLMQKFSNEFEGDSFNSLFIKAYYSHFLHLRKPDIGSYLKILEEQNLAPGETLFIDDTLANIQGAQKAGMPTIHLQPPQTLLDLKL
jgi:putative hydrolase of the HAD superfamily